MVGPPARRGDRRFSCRPRGAVARRLFSERGAREVGGLFAYVSSLGYLSCFSFVLRMLRGVSVAQCGLLASPTPHETRGDGVWRPCPPPGKRQRRLHAPPGTPYTVFFTRSLSGQLCAGIASNASVFMGPQADVGRPILHAPRSSWILYAALLGWPITAPFASVQYLRQPPRRLPLAASKHNRTSWIHGRARDE